MKIFVFSIIYIIVLTIKIHIQNLVTVQHSEIFILLPYSFEISIHNRAYKKCIFSKCLTKIG